jgi:hypothetical protein
MCKILIINVLFSARLRDLPDGPAAFALGSLHSPKHWRAGLLRLIDFLIAQYLDDPRYGVSPICNVRTCASRVRAKFIFGYNCKNFTFFWTCKYYLYICIVVLYYSFFDVLPPLLTLSSVARCSPTLPLNLLVMNILPLC